MCVECTVVPKRLIQSRSFVWVHVFVCMSNELTHTEHEISGSIRDVFNWSMRMSHKSSIVMWCDCCCGLLFNTNTYAALGVFYSAVNSAHLACIQYDAILHILNLVRKTCVLQCFQINAILIYYNEQNFVLLKNAPTHTFENIFLIYFKRMRILHTISDWIYNNRLSERGNRIPKSWISISMKSLSLKKS